VRNGSSSSARKGAGKIMARCSIGCDSTEVVPSEPSLASLGLPSFVLGSRSGAVDFGALGVV
jgi:hypothetical protein